MTSRGTTYITVGGHGFYYRETISSRKRIATSSSPLRGGGISALGDSIGTADVSELVDSSNAALIDRLNQRARMVNPAWFLYPAGAALLIFAISLLTIATNPPETPSLPDVTRPLSADRKINEIDEYPLLLARYGQPSRVIVTPSRSLPLRTAIYDAAHLRIVFVPNGCLDAYEFHEAHKEDANTGSLIQKVRQGRPRRSKTFENGPGCVLPWDKGAAIVGYEDNDSDSDISADSAHQRLAAMGPKLTSQPAISGGVDSMIGGDIPDHPNAQLTSEALSIRFSQETLKAEQRRLNQVESAREQTRGYGISLLFGGIGILIGGGYFHRHNRIRRTTRLVYELSETARQNQSVLDQSLTYLARSHMIWRVVAKSPTYDWKRNAGAAYLVHRTCAAVRASAPPRIESNVPVNCLDLGATRLYFLPDMALYWESGSFGAISYDDLALEQRPTRFIEDEHVPSDAIQIDRTWLYVRKDGGPDRRFNNNRRIPVMQYGAVTITSSNGLNILLNASNVESTAAFVNCLLEFKARRGTKVASESDDLPERKSASYRNALKVLGLEPGASLDKISEAYRSLAQMYHPDKVAGLAPEFHEIAERRMKEINAAYRLLKRPGETC